MTRVGEQVVSGRITRADSGEGVHGLGVEVRDRCSGRRLGAGLTARDGAYLVCVAAAADDVCIVVHDRDGRVVHDGCADCCACPHATPARIDMALAPQALWWHLSAPVSWEHPGPLLDPVMLPEIAAALALLSVDLPARLVPPLAGFAGVVDDAWAAIDGDVVAAGRVRDVLDLLCGTVTCDITGLEGAVSGIVGELWYEPADIACDDEPPGAGCAQEPVPEHPPVPCGCGDGEPGCPCRPGVVPDDVVAVLLMAALQLACGHAPSAVRYIAVVLDQVRRFDLVGAMHRAASRALDGDPKALRHLGDLAAAGKCRTEPPCSCADCLPGRVERCLRDAVGAWRGVRCYTVAEVRPPQACPGETVVICGNGFGCCGAGTVAFRAHGSLKRGPIVEPTLWCDNRIEVTVPDGAGCGLVVLLPVQTVEVCGRFLDRRPYGCIDATFDGTSPDVLAFAVEGRLPGECIEPGTPLTASWNVCAADHVRVELLDTGRGTVLEAVDPAPDRGRHTFETGAIDRTTHVTVRLIATGTCSPAVVVRELGLIVQARPDLTVEGIEVTQAIQHYDAAAHLTDPADQGADNSRRLVVDKTAWVRVYLRSGQRPDFDGGMLEAVDGTLRVRRRTGGVWSTVAVLASQNGPRTARDAFQSYDAERGDIDATLNFVVPAGLMTGLLRLTAEVRSAVAQCPGNAARRSVTVDVNLRQTLNAAFITIGYNGPDAAGTGTLNLPAPTLADCQAETAWAMTTYPVSGAPNVRIAATFTTTTPLDDPRSCPGCCSPNWTPLLQQVANAVTADQAANPGGNWVYYGLVANGIPVNVPGCNGVATGGIAGRPVTYAHEIGHQFGLPHARCGNAGTGNATYPVYEPYDLPVDTPANPINSTNWTMASIGEYGLDINNGAIANPHDAEDFMSYCGPRWISVFTHDFLVNAPRLVPQTIPTGDGGALRLVRDDEPGFAPRRDVVAPRIHLLGRIGPGGVTVDSVARLATTATIGVGLPTRYIAQLLDADGRVLAGDTVYRYPSQGCCDGEGRPCCDRCAEEAEAGFTAYVDDVAPGARLRIVRGDDVHWERTSPDSTQRLTRVRATMGKAGEVRLGWSADAEAIDTWVRWSSDDGATWNALMVGVAGTSVEVPAAMLPAGPVRFQVLTHDGFATASAVSAAVELPGAPPSVTILYPREGDLAYPDKQVHLVGTAASSSGDRPADDEHVWYLDGTEVARGRDVWVPNPGPGQHAVALEAGGGRATSTLAVDGAVEG
ncbi:MAG: hypothetical protein L0H84_12740 [Pseudonocardia sp.]|nr:hypothetical protein [Pseudonocardia sp.]